MADDELSAPLGRKAKAAPRRFKLPTRYLPHAIAAGLGGFIFAFAGWALVVSDPTGGEPVAMVATRLGQPPGPPKPVMPGVVSVNPADGPRSYDGPDGTVVTIPVPPPAQAQAQAASPPPAGPGRNTVTIIDGSTGKRQEVPIAASQDTRVPVEQRLLETSRHGAIPRIAPDGVRPSEAYARHAAPAAGRKAGPRIAIVLTGLGVSANFTR